MAKLGNGGGSPQSALHSQAAKDDCLTLNTSGIYNISDLLTNDPGSAHNVMINIPGVTINNGVFSLPFGVTSFTYTEQMANGTFSTASVHVAAREGGELVQNWSFEEPRPDATLYGGSIVDGQVVGGFTSGPTLPGGWINNNAVSLEDVSVQYGGFGTGIAGDDHWLDSQGSPGGIDITQVLQMTAGQAHMEFVVAKEPDIVTGGGVFKQDPTEQLHFLLGGKEVAKLTVSDFAAAGKFQTFDFDTQVAAGANTLEIKADNANAYVGFAIDSVSVRQMVAAPCMDGTA